MEDNTNLNILDTDAPLQVEAHLKPQLDLMTQLVNYGTLLMPRAWVSSPKNLEDGIIIFHLLRQVVMQFDSFKILVTNAAIPAASQPFRALLEAAVIIEWILKEDTKSKALHLFVGAWREERATAEALIPGTAGHATLMSDLPSAHTPELEAAAIEKVTSIDKIQSDPTLGPIFAEFVRVRGRRGFEPAWTLVYDSSRRIAAGESERNFSIRMLFDEAGRMNEYRRLYSHLSGESHGAAMLGSIKFEGKQQFSIQNIRNLSQFDSKYRTAVAIVIRTYRMVLKKYRPGEAHDNFPKKYSEDWKPTYDQKLNINVTAKMFTM